MIKGACQTSTKSIPILTGGYSPYGSVDQQVVECIVTRPTRRAVGSLETVGAAPEWPNGEPVRSSRRAGSCRPLWVRCRTKTDINPAVVASYPTNGIPHNIPQPFPGVEVDIFFVEHGPYPHGRVIRGINARFDKP